MISHYRDLITTLLRLDHATCQRYHVLMCIMLQGTYGGSSDQGTGTDTGSGGYGGSSDTGMGTGSGMGSSDQVTLSRSMLANPARHSGAHAEFVATSHTLVSRDSCSNALPGSVQSL